MPESIGPVRWRLQMPHVGLADFRHLQRLLLRQYAKRPSTPRLIAIWIAIALAFGLLPDLAVHHWNIWLDGNMAVGIGLRPLPLIEQVRFRWVVFALVLAGIFAAWLLYVLSYWILIRPIYDGSLRTRLET